jgi:hypothetical protein
MQPGHVPLPATVNGFKFGHSSPGLPTFKTISCRKQLQFIGKNTSLGRREEAETYFAMDSFAFFLENTML